MPQSRECLNAYFRLLLSVECRRKKVFIYPFILKRAHSSRSPKKKHNIHTKRMTECSTLNCISFFLIIWLLRKTADFYMKKKQKNSRKTNMLRTLSITAPCSPHHSKSSSFSLIFFFFSRHISKNKRNSAQKLSSINYFLSTLGNLWGY